MDYQTWFRKWNNIAYDWLHQYLFADIKAVSGGAEGWERLGTARMGVSEEGMGIHYI